MGGQPTNLMGSHHWNNKYKIHPLEKLEMMVALLFTSLIPLSTAKDSLQPDGFSIQNPQSNPFFFLSKTQANFNYFSKTPPIFKFVLSKTLLTCSVGVLIANTPPLVTFLENLASKTCFGGGVLEKNEIQLNFFQNRNLKSRF